MLRRQASSLSKLLVQQLTSSAEAALSEAASASRQFSSAGFAARGSVSSQLLVPCCRAGSNSYESVFPASAAGHVRPFSLWGSKSDDPKPQEGSTSLTDLGSDADAAPIVTGATPSAGVDSFDASALRPEAAAEAPAAADAASSSIFDPSLISQAATAGEADALAASIADSNFLSAGIQELLNYAHLASGTAWWESIALATLTVRILTSPFAIMAVKNTYRMSAARPEMLALQEWYKKEAMMEGEVGRARKEYSERMAGVWKKYQCNPLKSMAPIAVQAPLFIGFFMALRAMAEHKVPSMTEGGAFWFSDLTLADPYYALPIVSSLVFLITIELGAADGMQGQDPAQMSRMKNFMRALAVAMVPLTASMPQSVFCYWITSNAYSLLQSVVLKIPSVKKALGLPNLTPAAAASSDAPHIPIITYSAPPRKSRQVVTVQANPVHVQQQQSQPHQPQSTVFPEPKPRIRGRKKR